MEALCSAFLVWLVAGPGVSVFSQQVCPDPRLCPSLSPKGHPGWTGGLFGAIFGGVGHEEKPAMGPFSFLFKAGERFGF